MKITCWCYFQICKRKVHCHSDNQLSPYLDIKAIFPRYGDSHVKDRTVGIFNMGILYSWDGNFMLRWPPVFWLNIAKSSRARVVHEPSTCFNIKWILQVWRLTVWKYLNLSHAVLHTAKMASSHWNCQLGNVQALAKIIFL